jgi:subtilisin family serine protease
MNSFPRELSADGGPALHLDASRLLLGFASPKTRAEVEAATRPFGVVPEAERLPTSHPEHFEVVNHTATRVWVRTVDGKALPANKLSLLAKLPDLLWVGPVYQSVQTSGVRGLICLLPNVLLVRAHTSLDPAVAAQSAALLATFALEEHAIKSTYLAPYRYFLLKPGAKTNAFAIRAELLQKGSGFFSDVTFESMPMIIVPTMVPSDTYFDRQWNMTQIQAGGPGRTGWDLSTGAAFVVIAILDWGFDLDHPDLNFASPGINLGRMSGDGRGSPGFDQFHGTCCAGVAAARINNGTGVAGVAGNCRILPLAFEGTTSAELALGFNYAVAHGASVISMSFGLVPDTLTFGPVYVAIDNAVTVHDCLLVGSSGNDDRTRLEFPGNYRSVMTVGGSDQEDNRKSPESPDGQCWGANYGGKISVVAPCILIPTTDQRGTAGRNNNGGGSVRVACVDYLVSGDAEGDYLFLFGGTSASTPHVAGLAALLRSRYPTLTRVQVQSIIELTAEKVGNVLYTDTIEYPNGLRNDEMGYGRINVFRALDFGDVLIKDWPGDNGVEPSTPPGGNFWDFSDIVIRPDDDDVFDPTNLAEANRVERGRAHFLYVRVTNRGPQEARNVAVTVRITPFVGLEFFYPADWTMTDATHVSPTALIASFPAIAAGRSLIAKFEISVEQVDELWGWSIGRRWHPCVLAAVTAENDYAFASLAGFVDTIVTRRNNLTQRNLSVIGVTGAATLPPHLEVFPFIGGNHANAETQFEISVDCTELPAEAEVLLALDEDGNDFPRVDFKPKPPAPLPTGDSIVLRERASFDVKWKDWQGVLTLEKGSRFDGQHGQRLSVVAVKGGEVVLRAGRHYVLIRGQRAVIRLRKEPRSIHPLALHVTLPGETPTGFHTLRVSQQNEKGATVGGATVCFEVGR